MIAVQGRRLSVQERELTRSGLEEIRKRTATLTDGIDTFVFEATTDYIEVPVLIRGNIPGSGSVKARVFGGPAFAFKVSDDTTTTFNGVELDEEEPELKGNDFGLVIGGAVQFGQSSSTSDTTGD
jgi:Outer membrane protein beta-barrel domain